MSRAASVRNRKSPLQRRDEIVAAAGRIALSDGLQSLTLRRVAQELAVAPGLINHYFRDVDALVAAAFAAAAGVEREAVFAGLEAEPDPRRQVGLLLDRLSRDDSDAISLVWLDAWQASRSRPPLKEEVRRQMLAWQEQLAALVARGQAAGVFSPGDASAAAQRILALIDGLSVQAALRHSIDFAAVREMVFAGVERELGLDPGGLA